MATTFAQPGIPFPLFEAPIDQAVEYCGEATCGICGETAQHCFCLGIGCALMLNCPECDALAGLDADDQDDAICSSCGATIAFPDVDEEEIAVCYACLRSGKAAITKDTELGMISSDQAIEGVTHGLPGLNRSDFEMVPDQGAWVGARLPQEVMWELLRTPTYSTIQGDRWQFCCGSPMIFIGEWSRDEFSRRAPDGDGRRFFHEIVQRAEPGLWEDELHDTKGIYVFRCSHCGGLTAHWDIA
jgi:uncharacterized protein CbrC (UPF0167 family)